MKEKLNRIFKLIYFLLMTFVPIGVFLIGTNTLINLDCLNIETKAIIFSLFEITCVYWGLKYYELTQN